SMCRRFPDLSLLYSERAQASGRERILWIDNIGMLSRLYAYGDIAYVGGAFGKGLHNVLEPAAFGKPVFFGPRYGRFPEAVEMIKEGCAFAVSFSQNLTSGIQKILADPAERERISRTQIQHIQQRSGATRMIADWCKENLL
ncbi:MAG: 3-deoxy-D-manno-octulosonic acid transferase, partial [Bacteroidetes bacterium]